MKILQKLALLLLVTVTFASCIVVTPGRPWGPWGYWGGGPRGHYHYHHHWHHGRR